MSNKVAVIIPVHPPKKNYLIELLKTYVVNKEYIDIFLVFTTDADKLFFSDILTSDIYYILLDHNINLNILQKNLSFINFKKIYALNYVSSNYNYNYSIVIDCDSFFLDMRNIYNICERFCIKKEVYGTKVNQTNMSGVPISCKNFIETYSNSMHEHLDIDTYFWFSQIPIYDMDLCKKFLKFININNNNIINNITYSTFDYIIYMYYCVIYHNYKIVNLNNYNIYTKYQPQWSLEWNVDNEMMDKLIFNNIEINWQSFKFKNVINDNICMIYHTDRREIISRSEPISVPLQIILDPIKILGIGSCRILTPLYKLYKHNKNIVIHNCLENFFENQTFTGNNFLGKLHNSKEIIQFIKFLKNDVILPERILKLFLTGFSRFRCPQIERECDPDKILKDIRNDFNNISTFFIEISSIKVYVFDNFYVNVEHISSPNPYINNYKDIMYTQTKEDLISDLKNIIDIIGNKKIVFITHLNINNIQNRVIIKESIEYVTRDFNSNNNIYMIDPMTVINKENLLEDELHFNIEGINEYINYLKIYI
jgi:hypothetical protein